MKQVIAEAIATANEVIGLSLEHREDYSGRGMFGAETHAIVGSESEFLQACAYAAATIAIDDAASVGLDEEVDEEAFDLAQFIGYIGGLRKDSMGRSDLVWY